MHLHSETAYCPLEDPNWGGGKEENCNLCVIWSIAIPSHWDKLSQLSYLDKLSQFPPIGTSCHNSLPLGQVVSSHWDKKAKNTCVSGLNFATTKQVAMQCAACSKCFFEYFSTVILYGMSLVLHAAALCINYFNGVTSQKPKSHEYFCHFVFMKFTAQKCHCMARQISLLCTSLNSWALLPVHNPRVGGGSTQLRYFKQPWPKKVWISWTRILH